MKRHFFVIWLLLAVPCSADVRLPRILGSNMVLQRESEVNIWGWADAGEAIHVTCDWSDNQERTNADANGNWRISLKTGAAGGPHSIAITGKTTVQMEQILFGEVWVASGQSNMEMPLIRVSDAYTGIKNAVQEVGAADDPEIRLLQVGNFSSKQPLDDVQSGSAMYGVPAARCKWQACTSDTVPTFASAAYFFARELRKELKVPIGIIDASWGGTAAEAWTPASGLEALGGYEAELEQARSLPQNADRMIPTRLFNGMIHPLLNFKIKGVVWYQGESNAVRAEKYEKLFSTMIGSWREAFGHPFPFYFVQISPFNYGELNVAYLREAQLATMSLPRTGMVVTMDIGNLADIHPKNKQEVGRRLALWALSQDYGRDIVFSGPIYKESVFGDGKVRLKFHYVGTGLTTRDGKTPSNFEVAGADQVFHSATAVIDGDDLIIASDKVAAPQAVRYAFTSQAVPNLMNKEGLPAAPFRTDNW